MLYALRYNQCCFSRTLYMVYVLWERPGTKRLLDYAKYREIPKIQRNKRIFKIPKQSKYNIQKDKMQIPKYQSRKMQNTNIKLRKQKNTKYRKETKYNIQKIQNTNTKVQKQKNTKYKNTKKYPQNTNNTEYKKIPKIQENT